MKRFFIILMVYVLYVPIGYGQADSVSYCFYVIENGDTIPCVTINPPQVVTYKFASKSEQRKFNRIQRKIIKVYPYANAAGDLMNSYEEELSKMDKKKDQKEFMKIAEKELKDQFEGELKNMTISEGVILIKLIDRQTGDTSFELIKDLKGGFSAFMWQTVARLFSHNLKDQYNPDDDEEDLMIEEIVSRIELGLIEVKEKEVKSIDAKMVLDN